MSDADAIVRMVVDRAQSQLDAQLLADDAVDLKALGVLAADATAVGVLVAAHSTLNPSWWVPMVVLSIAALVLLVVVYPIELDDGPRWAEWYETFGGGTVYDVGRQMIADLTAAIDGNSQQMTRNGRVFKVGFVLRILGLVGCVVVGLDR